MEQNNREKIESLANRIMRYARDSILVNMRFLDVALSALTPVVRNHTGQIACDGKHLYYDPVYLLKKYKEEPAFAIRLYLHVLLHLIFYHSFRYDKVERSYWDLAADIAVENTILEMKMPGSVLSADDNKKRKLRVLSEDISALTAEKLYRYFKNNQFSAKELAELSALFFVDEHVYWQQSEKLEVTMEQWKKLSERVKADLKSFSKGKNNSESLSKNLEEATKDRYNYAELLKKFTVMNEDMQINDDEFDYIYYTYGLKQYGNMPLVEPLEYKDARKIKDFVIAIDTSASCRGELVQAFLQKTYSILMTQESFFRKMNVHIIQCDSEVQKDTKITCREDFEAFLKSEKLAGFGSTDFRPVFAYVDELLQKGEFENLKGLIYFTDGYGVYPGRMPAYEVMFAFLNENENGPEVPPWAIKVVLEADELEE